MSEREGAPEMTEIHYRGLSEPTNVKTIRVPAAEAERAIEMIRGSDTLELVELQCCPNYPRHGVPCNH